MARKRKRDDIRFAPLPESTSGPGGSISNARFDAFKRNLGTGINGKPMVDTSGLKPGQYEAFAQRPGSNRIVGDAVSNIPGAVSAVPLRAPAASPVQAAARARSLFGGTGGRAHTPLTTTTTASAPSSSNPLGRKLTPLQKHERSQASRGRTGIRWDKIREQIGKEEAKADKDTAREQFKEDRDADIAGKVEVERAGRATPEEQEQVIKAESDAAIAKVNAEADAAINVSGATKEDELAKIREKAKAEGDAKTALAAAEAEIAARMTKVESTTGIVDTEDGPVMRTTAKSTRNELSPPDAQAGQFADVNGDGSTADEEAEFNFISDALSNKDANGRPIHPTTGKAMTRAQEGRAQAKLKRLRPSVIGE